jgi:hypothetical protein
VGGLRRRRRGLGLGTATWGQPPLHLASAAGMG